MGEISVKTCTKCKESKLLSEFYKRSDRVGSLVSSCKDCQSERRKHYYNSNKKSILKSISKWQDNNPEKVKVYHKRWRERNPDKLRVNEARYRENNRARLSERTRRYYSLNGAKVKASNKAWVVANPKKKLAIDVRRKVSKLQRTPIWFEKEAINQFYIGCPEGHHVDHIIPLKGKNVSGLHVLSNLQYLSSKKNLSKHNKYLPIVEYYA